MRFYRNLVYDSRGFPRRVPRMRVPVLRFHGHGPVGEVRCPCAGREVSFLSCLECHEFRVWSAKDGDFRRCRHELLDLEARGYYDGTWDEHPENFNPETFAEIQERKRLNEQFLRDFESEKAERERLARELDEEAEREEDESTDESEDGDEY